MADMEQQKEGEKRITLLDVLYILAQNDYYKEAEVACSTCKKGWWDSRIWVPTENRTFRGSTRLGRLCIGSRFSKLGCSYFERISFLIKCYGSDPVQVFNKHENKQDTLDSLLSYVEDPLLVRLMVEVCGLDPSKLEKPCAPILLYALCDGAVEKVKVLLELGATFPTTVTDFDVDPIEEICEKLAQITTPFPNVLRAAALLEALDIIFSAHFYSSQSLGKGLRKLCANIRDPGPHFIPTALRLIEKGADCQLALFSLVESLPSSQPIEYITCGTGVVVTHQISVERVVEIALQLIDLMLAAGASINHQSADGISLLMVCAIDDIVHSAVMSGLIRRGCDLNLVTNITFERSAFRYDHNPCNDFGMRALAWQYSALFTAVCRDQPKTARALIAAGCDIHLGHDYVGNGPLAHAFSSCSLEMIQVFLETGCTFGPEHVGMAFSNTYSRCFDGAYPPDYLTDRVTTSAFLIKTGNFTPEERSGLLSVFLDVKYSPYDIAANDFIIKALLEERICISANQLAQLILADCEFSDEIYELVIIAGGDELKENWNMNGYQALENEEFINIESPILLALKQNGLVIPEDILPSVRGVVDDICTGNCKNVVSDAILLDLLDRDFHSQFPDNVNFFNAEEGDSWNLLMLAAVKGRPTVFQGLLEAGARLDSARSAAGETADMIAQRLNRTKMLEYLEIHHARERERSRREIV